MATFRFRNWKIYNDLRSFRLEIIKEIIPLIPKAERFELVSQLKRALNSSILNIAEGAYRSSDKDFAHFINQSVTSLNEVVACFDILVDENYINKSLHSKFLGKAEELVAQLSGFHRFLKK